MIFRANERKVEKVIIKSMPLGSVEYFPYAKEMFTLNPGDTLLMMTDGLPELFSPQRELLGYERVEEKFLEVGDQSATMIINQLSAWAESWVEKKSINDDITLVVLKAS
jgi:serine phosphatase RsbU (regulator of sigma subunit)